MECLSLTLEEVVHIRSVLTKAELDSLPVECHIKEDVARGKLCFLCMKTRFSFFGSKGNNCRLCQRVVCAKCCAKVSGGECGAAVTRATRDDVKIDG